MKQSVKTIIVDTFFVVFLIGIGVAIGYLSFFFTKGHKEGMSHEEGYTFKNVLGALPPDTPKGCVEGMAALGVDLTNETWMKENWERVYNTVKSGHMPPKEYLTSHPNYDPMKFANILKSWATQ